MAFVKLIIITHALLVKHFTINAVMTAQIYSSLSEEIAGINPA
jgi:hypothetical protein